jgi:hypothetical protein
MNIPKVIPRISQKRIHDDPSIGCGVQLRQKFRFLTAMGVFGKSANFHTICQQMYETTTFREPKTDKKTGETKMVEFVNDASAYTRLDNICRSGQNCKSVIQAELDFLRQGFEHLFGDNAMAFITDDMMLKGSMLQLLKSLTGTETSVDWTGIDPILALNAIAAASDPDLNIEIMRSEGTRWTAQKGGVQPVAVQDSVEMLPTGAGYKLIIDATRVSERPFVFEFLDSSESRTADDRPVRAQLLPLPIREHDGEGPWRVSARLNRPLVLGNSEGRFGFCAVSGLGLSLDDLFPSGYDPKCLSDEDLQFLIGEMLSHATSATPPVVGMRRYHLVTPDARESRTKNRGG